MKTIYKNKKEDIKLLIDLGADYHGEDLVLTFSAGQYGLNKFICSYVGGVQTNCVVNNSTVLCLLDNHGLSLGMLSVEIDIRVPDTQMPDGDFRHVTQKIASFVLGGEECSLELTNGASDYFPEELVPESVINLLPTVIKGEPGKDADIEGCNAAIASTRELEEAVAKAEAERKKAESERQSSETERKQSEEARLQSENDRNSSEQERKKAEEERNEAEASRNTAETQRVEAESQRQKDAEDAIASMESAERKATEATKAAQNATENANNATSSANEATANAVAATQNAQSATEATVIATEKANAATTNANAATKNATTAANRATELSNKAEETIAKSEKAVSDAVSAVENANNANKAATTAVTNANEATKNANTAAENARVAAERSNEAADLVYNGEPVRITIYISTTAQNVSVSGLNIKVWFDGSKETTAIITTDENGTAFFDCPALAQYTIEYPVIGGCLEIPDTNGYGGLKTKTYNIAYQPLPESLEQLTIRIYKWIGNHQGTKFADVPVHLTIDGETTDYFTDANGEVIVEIPFGKEYTYSVDNVEGLYLYANINSWTFTAGVASRIRVINYRDLNIGLFFVCQDGAEFTYQQFVDSGRDGSDALLIKIVNYEVASTGNIFGILIDDIADGTYLNNNRQWCVSNVQFTSIPLNSQSANGLSNTVSIVNEGQERSLTTAAATHCLDLILDYGDMSLQGFLPAVLQKYAVVANESELNEMLAYVRPNAKYNFTKFCDTSTWTSDQSIAASAYFCGRSASSSNKYNSNPVLPFYAF